MNRFEAAILDAYRPALIPIDDQLVGAAFPLMKIFPAEFCVRQAIEEGAVDADSLILETSSGTMALGLAIVCKLRSLPLTIVTDYACDPVLRQRLEGLGARVEIVPAPALVGGYQRARLDRLFAIRDAHPGAWWLNQYDNPGNSASYATFAGQLVDTFGRIDCLVGTVGSGGSVCGTSAFLRVLFPDLVVVGVDTFGSVLFGQPDRPRQLRGLGNSLLPRNVDHTTFDEVHWVSAAEAYCATRLLHRKTTLYRGGTSGAAWMVAQLWARQHRNARVVCILPDDGQRYRMIYDEPTLREQGLWLDTLPAAPIEVAHPRDATSTWSSFAWRRRPHADVVASGGARMPMGDETSGTGLSAP